MLRSAYLPCGWSSSAAVGSTYIPPQKSSDCHALARNSVKFRDCPYPGVRP